MKVTIAVNIWYDVAREELFHGSQTHLSETDAMASANEDIKRDVADGADPNNLPIRYVGTISKEFEVP